MRYSYKVTLLADVVMSSLSSTEVSKSLDYLSGSAFMGIAANYLFKNKPKDYDVFDDIFSGKIRFLDAHPLINGKRSFKIPLCLHKPKVKDDGEIYRFEGKPVQREENREDKIQMKQIRKGFFTADGTTWKKVEPEHQYTMKSSYDSKTRRAEDNALFGYDALVKGSEWVFVMEFDDEKRDIAQELDRFFTSQNHRIGKSKTSQYGNVEIKRDDSLLSDCGTCAAKENKYKVYADSRLCFFDENGQPTFLPTAEQLGFDKDDKILWNESFVRKYVFTPRNAARNAYDGDIACIDKGSVITVESETGHDGRTVAGEYQSTGLGQIIVNPEFLKEPPEHLKNIDKNDTKPAVPCNDPLILWLESKQNEKEAEQKIAEKVNENVKGITGGKVTASQWGVLRAKARTAIVENKKWRDFHDDLFSEITVKVDKWGKEEKKGYLFKDRLNKIWKGRIKSLETAFNRADETWTDTQKLRYFELLCAAAAKKSKNKD